MKIILYMTVTANGFIATLEGGTEWVSPAAQEEFRQLAKQTGNVVFGHNTYAAMVAASSFPVPGVLNVVMTSQPPDVDPIKNVIFFTESLEDMIQELSKQGMAEILVAGGGQLAGSFMTDGLVDEIYLTIEPLMLGQGIHLFEHAEFERQLELIGSKNVSDHEVQLHYAVRKYTVEGILSEEAAG
jgi:dihydrofolate reductase